MSEPYDILKISGETLSGQGKMFFDGGPLGFIVDEIVAAHREGPPFGVVVGGGNLIRGGPLQKEVGLQDTVVADYCGMLSTVINASVLQDKLEAKGLPVRLMTATEMKEYGERFIRRKAMKYLRQGEIVILAGGTGNPGFSTDSAGVLRAFELRARMLFKGTKVDGVYSDDPLATEDTLERYDYLSYDEYIQKKLKALDTHAVSLAASKNVRIRVFDIFKKGSFVRARKAVGAFTDIGPEDENPLRSSEPGGSRTDPSDFPMKLIEPVGRDAQDRKKKKGPMDNVPFTGMFRDDGGYTK